MTSDAELIERVKPLSKATPQRMQALIWALRYLDKAGVDGDLAECGVYRGANAIICRTIAPARKLWLYDTFEGMTKPSEEDGEWAARKFEQKGVGWLKVSMGEVLVNIEEAGANWINNIHMVPGDVCSTLRKSENLPAMLALLICDTDFYPSTKASLTALYCRLANGGVLLIDDYGYWPGAKRAVDEFFGARGPPTPWIEIDGTGLMTVKGNAAHRDFLLGQ